jgi:hypothetical protein
MLISDGERGFGMIDRDGGEGVPSVPPQWKDIYPAKRKTRSVVIAMHTAAPGRAPQRRIKNSSKQFVV